VRSPKERPPACAHHEPRPAGRSEEQVHLEEGQAGQDGGTMSGDMKKAVSRWPRSGRDERQGARPADHGGQAQHRHPHWRLSQNDP